MTTSTQRWTLGLTAAAAFMVALDQLVVATALDRIRLDLHASISTLDWTINAFSLSFAVLLITGAALGDRFGRRRLFAVGTAIFTVASAACALAPNAGTLIAARAVQGSGAALVTPLAVALLTAAFPPQRRGPIVGIFTAFTGLAVAGGPVVGGAVAQGIAWQWIFWLNVPVGVLLIPLALGKIAESRGPRGRFDLVGLGLICAGIFGLVWGLVRADVAGWSSAEVIGTLVGGSVLCVAFVAWEVRVVEPMLPMHLFRIRSYSAANAAMLLLTTSLFGSVFLFAQYLQVSLGYEPFAAGLRFLPWTGALFFVAPLSGALLGRIGGRPLLATGLVLQAHRAGLGRLRHRAVVFVRSDGPSLDHRRLRDVDGVARRAEYGHELGAGGLPRQGIRDVQRGPTTRRGTRHRRCLGGVRRTWQLRVSASLPRRRRSGPRRRRRDRTPSRGRCLADHRRATPCCRAGDHADTGGCRCRRRLTSRD